MGTTARRRSSRFRSRRLLRELRCADAWNKRWDNYFSDAQIVQMATSWGAAVLGFSDVLATREEQAEWKSRTEKIRNEIKERKQSLPRLKGDEKKEAEKNNEAARLWISGLEAVNRKLGASRVIDLSATP